MVVDYRNRDSFAELYQTSELYCSFGFLMYDSADGGRAAATRGTLCVDPSSSLSDQVFGAAWILLGVG